MQSKLNILFANSIQMFAGGEVWMLRTMGELQNRGHHVTLLCRPGTELAERAERQNISTHRIKITGDFNPATILKIARFLKQNRIDVILTNMDKELRLCGMAAKLTDHPPVISRRGIDYPLKNKIHYRLSYNWLANQVVANSQSTKKALLRNAPWLNPDRIQVIYNGLNPENYDEAHTHDLREELKIPSGVPLVGFVGQLDERKGFDALLPAFQYLTTISPDAILLLAGTGPLENQIKTFAKENQLENNIKILGFRNDIPNLMRTIDLLVLPSWWEGFGIVLIEAMAAGKPTITTAVSSMPEIVTHEKTGLIVPPHDRQALATALEKIITNPQLARQMGESGQRDVLDRFTLEKMVDKYEALFYQLIKKKNA